MQRGEKASSSSARKKRSSNRKVGQANADRLASQYIANPHLIKGHKYDLRVYALVTCLDPLRVGVTDPGLCIQGRSRQVLFDAL